MRLCVFCSTDVNVAFQQAAHKVLLDDDNLLPLLHLTVDYQGKDSKGALLNELLYSFDFRTMLFFIKCLAPSSGVILKLKQN